MTYSVFRILPVDLTSSFSVTSRKVLWSHYGYSAYFKTSWELNLYSHLPIVIHSLFWIRTLVINLFLIHSWYLQCCHLEREVLTRGIICHILFRTVSRFWRIRSLVSAQSRLKGDVMVLLSSHTSQEVHWMNVFRGRHSEQEPFSATLLLIPLKLYLTFCAHY